ncbi:hypothetical protein GIB67_016633, partial [Kingdonia uniflora]
MNEKVPPTASNRRKKELAREGDLVTYKRKIKTIDPSTIVPPNTVDSANEGVSEGVNIPTESAEGVNISQGLEFETESAQAGLGAQPPLPNVCLDFDENILIFGGYSKGGEATSNDDEKLPIRVHHHQSTWDLRKEPQVVQDFVKLKGLDKIGAIFYNYYNSALISTFVERWQPKTSSFHFKWCEMTQTLDDVEQLVELPADGDVTVIGGTWGFPAILEVFKNNLLQDLNAFKSLKAGGAENSLSLKKLKEHYAYKLDKVLSDGTAAAAKKKKGLTTSVRYLVLFAKDKVAKMWLWGLAVLVHMYYNLGAASRDDTRQFACCTTLLEILEYKNLEKKNTSLEAELRSKFGLEDCNQSLFVVLNKKCKEIESLKAVNTILMEQIDMQLPPATPLVVLQSHQSVPDTTLAKKYEDLLAAHEDVKKKFIAKEDFHKKLVNSEERKKTLEVDNNEWEVWRQALKKALASEGMGDMGDPTFEELFEQNERFFIIAQQGPKGDYQKDLVSTAVTLENVIISRREKIDKKKKMQELLFQ